MIAAIYARKSTDQNVPDEGGAHGRRRDGIYQRGSIRIMLASLCALLGVVASVSAECAWVLWERLTGLSGTEHWVLAARSSEQDCRALVRPAVQRRTDLVGAPGPGAVLGLHLPPRHGGPARAEGEVGRRRA